MNKTLLVLSLLLSASLLGCSSEEGPSVSPAKNLGTPTVKVTDFDGDGIVDREELSEAFKYIKNIPTLQANVAMEMTYADPHGGERAQSFRFVEEKIHTSLWKALSDDEKLAEGASALNPFARHFKIIDELDHYKVQSALLHCLERCAKISFDIDGQILLKNTAFKELRNPVVRMGVTFYGTSQVKSLGELSLNEQGSATLEVSLSNALVQSILDETALLSLEIVDGDLLKKDQSVINFKDYQEELHRSSSLLISYPKDEFEGLTTHFIIPGKYSGGLLRELSGLKDVKNMSFTNAQFSNDVLNIQVGEYYTEGGPYYNSWRYHLCSRSSGACDSLFQNSKVSELSEGLIYEIDLERDEDVSFLKVVVPHAVLLSSRGDMGTLTDIKGCTIGEVILEEREIPVMGLFSLVKNFRLLLGGVDVTESLQKNKIIKAVATDERLYIRIDLKKNRETLNLKGKLQLSHRGRTNDPKPLYEGGLSIHKDLFEECSEKDLLGKVEFADVNPNHSDLALETEIGANLKEIRQTVREATFVSAESFDKRVERLFKYFRHVNVSFLKAP